MESYLQSAIDNFARTVILKKEKLIKDRLAVVTGVNYWSEDYIREHVIRIKEEGDKFEHYYFDFGKETEQRLVSISDERIPEYS